MFSSLLGLRRPSSTGLSQILGNLPLLICPTVGCLTCLRWVRYVRTVRMCGLQGVRVPMKIEVDLTVCAGHGRCYAVAPEIFEPDDEGYSIVILKGPVPAELEGAARKAVEDCPERAIRVTDG
jgi:ferredoxin